MPGACCPGASYPIPHFDASTYRIHAVEWDTMDTPTIYLKNTVSGVVSEFDRATAERYLEHPDYSQILVVVDSPKNEVLAQPYKLGENGERVPVEDEQPAEIIEPSEVKNAPKKDGK